MNRYQEVLKYFKVLPIILIVFGIVIILANVTSRGLPLRDVGKTFDNVKPQTKEVLAETLSKLASFSKAGLEEVASWFAGSKDSGIGPTYHFSPGEKFYEFILGPGEFSQWIALPADTTNALVDTNDKSYKFCVWSKSCEKRFPGKHYPTTLTIQEAIFRIVNTEAEPITVMIKIERK